MKKPMIYIASPFSKGDQFLNLRAHIDIYNRLLDYGRVIPIAPLMSAFAHMVEPRSYEEWLALDFELIERCDALFANNAIIFSDQESNGIPVHIETESPGRDREADHALKIGIPVFSDFDRLKDWVEKWRR